MWTKDSRGREITADAKVRWNDPPHLGGETRHGVVVGPIKGGWFRIRECEPGSARGAQRKDGDPLVKPSSLTVEDELMPGSFGACAFCASDLPHATARVQELVRASNPDHGGSVVACASPCADIAVRSGSWERL